MTLSKHNPNEDFKRARDQIPFYTILTIIHNLRYLDLAIWGAVPESTRDLGQIRQKPADTAVREN